MKNYYLINEDFFDGIETSEITDTEIGNENEPFVETVPSVLNEISFNLLANSNVF